MARKGGTQREIDAKDIKEVDLMGSDDRWSGRVQFVGRKRIEG